MNSFFSVSHSSILLGKEGWCSVDLQRTFDCATKKGNEVQGIHIHSAIGSGVSSRLPISAVIKAVSLPALTAFAG